ncbi:MAG: FMN-binding protein [Lachnospiraceae bacterium]|nr:FMN-binding protein [Lachnospiraceae bacterium]
MKRIIAWMLSATLLLAGCGGKQASYKDGTYEAQSEVYQSEDGSEEGNGYGVVKLTIEGGAITDCSFVTYDENGEQKGEDYGKEDGRIANKDYYNKAQKANAACAEYASMLVANGSLDGIDAISGATINYNEFVEAVKSALKQAQE